MATICCAGSAAALKIQWMSLTLSCHDVTSEEFDRHERNVRQTCYLVVRLVQESQILSIDWIVLRLMSVSPQS